MTNDDVVEWLVQISAHLREQKEMMRDSHDRERKEKDSGPSWLDKFEKKLESALAVGVGTALGQAKSLTARGMSGTLEQAQQNYAMDQLGRQMAAVMLPMTQAMTYAAQQIEQRMRGWGGSEQNRMFGVVGGGMLGYRLGGPMGAIGGAMLGSGLMGEGTGRYDPYLGAAGGALLGGRVAGPYGAAVGAAVGWTANRGDYGALRKGGSGPVAAGLGAAFAGLGDASDWVVGLSNPLAYFGARALGVSSYGDRARHMMGISDRDSGTGGAAMGALRSPAAPRRDVTPFTPEMVDTGATAMRIQEGMIRATAGAGAEEGGPLKPLVDLGLAIFDVLNKILVKAGGDEVPRPGAAGR